MNNDEKLKIIGQIATDVPERIAGLVEQLAQFNSLVEDHTPEFTELHSQIRSKIQEAETELRLYLEESQAARTELIAVSGESRQTIERLAEQWESELDPLSAEVQLLTTQTEQLDTVVGNAAQRVTKTVEELQAAQQQVEQQFVTSKEQTSEKFEVTQSTCNALQHKLQAAETETQGQVTALVENMQEQHESLQARSSNLLGEVGSLIEDFEDLVTDLHLNVLTSGVDGMVETAVQKIENEAKTLIRETIGKVTEMSAELTDKITNAEGDTKLIREAIDPLIDDLDSLVSPLEGLLDAVRSVAGVFGSVASIF